MSDQAEANALIARANALHNAGSKLAAAPLYVEAAQRFAPYASFALVAGDSFREAGQDAEAIAAYRICLAEVPDHEQALEGMGASLLRVGRVDEAKEAYRKAGVPMPGAAAKKGLFKRLFGG